MLDDLLARKEHIGEALRRLPPYATALGEVVGSGPGFQINLYGLPPASLSEVLLDTYFQPGKLPDSLADYLRGLHRRTHHHQAEVAMTRVQDSTRFRNRTMRVVATIALLVVALVGGIWTVWPSAKSHQVFAYFPSTVGLYPGDDVRVVGRSGGHDQIHRASCQPTSRSPSTWTTASSSPPTPGPSSSRRTWCRPGSFSSRPTYKSGPTLADGAQIGLDRTGVPVEWDDVKQQLTALSASLGPQQGDLQGPLSAFVNQAADTFDGNGDSFRNALRELSQTAGRLGDSRTDLFGTVRNLQVLVNALANSNEQIVQFSNHVASVSQVLADSSKDLDQTLGDAQPGAVRRQGVPRRRTTPR